MLRSTTIWRQIYGMMRDATLPADSDLAMSASTKRSALSTLAGLLIGLGVMCAPPSQAAEEADEEDDEEAEAIVAPAAAGKPTKAGAVHSNIRRAREQASLSERAGGLYADYGEFKERVEEDYGLSWSLNLSYRWRWQKPADIARSEQLLFWPSLNWDIFDSERFGAGSLQALYFGERFNYGAIQVGSGARSRTIESPPYRNRFGQLTYTHTLPGEKLAVSIGQYSLFMFDSNPYLADQQQNFVNSAFSENPSSTYPVSGFGAYLQYNLRSDLQLLGGFQNAPRGDDRGFSTTGFSDHLYTWWGHVQWMPNVSGMGSAQYSLTAYQSPELPDTPRSSGWSLNVAQNLNSHWAIFGRANHGWQHEGTSKSSVVTGVAFNNPLGRSATDQIALSVGASQQDGLLARRLGTDRSQMIEAYWNWTLLGGGILLTPDLQYIRHPSFAPNRDSILVFSLRTTLLF